MNKITEGHVDSIMAGSKFEIETKGDKTTILIATLPNGFVIVESSSCVDPVNYDSALGLKICQERIRDKIWMLEGYVLQAMMAAQNAVRNAVIDNLKLATTVGG